MLTTEQQQWLILSEMPDLSARQVWQFLEQRLTPADLVSGKSRSELSLTPSALEFLASGAEGLLSKTLAWLDGGSSNQMRHLVTPADALYPPQLRQLADAPLVLYVLGDPHLMQVRQLAVVGSRTPTSGGADHAKAFAHELAKQGWCITSGLALGIDAYAHQGALAAGGKTVAVIGTGIDRVYPANHKALAHQIVGSGCIVSELPLGVGPLKHHFPRRNRLIAALSEGVLVVEAALSSGSLITAREAADLGREVFALPGSVNNPLTRGPHWLIRQGAKLVETASDIVEELGSCNTTEAPTDIAAVSQTEHFDLDAQHRQLLDVMGYEQTSADQLVQRSGLPAEHVASMLLLLELQGWVESRAGSYQRRG